MFVFINPAESSSKLTRVNWEMAQKEIAEAKGFSVKNKHLTKGKRKILNKIIIKIDHKLIYSARIGTKISVNYGNLPLITVIYGNFIKNLAFYY